MLIADPSQWASPIEMERFLLAVLPQVDYLMLRADWKLSQALAWCEHWRATMVATGTLRPLILNVGLIGTIVNCLREDHMFPAESAPEIRALCALADGFHFKTWEWMAFEALNAVQQQGLIRQCRSGFGNEPEKRRLLGLPYHGPSQIGEMSRPENWDYMLISPVAKTLCKPGQMGLSVERQKMMISLARAGGFKGEFFALGGVHASELQAYKEKGYSGIAGRKGLFEII